MQNEESLKWQLEHEPLLQRAWVMQERLLAPRVVYFGSKEVFWQCSEHIASESWPGKIPGFLFVDRVGRPNDFQTSFMLSSFRYFHSDWFAGPQDQAKVRGVWYPMVKFYSHCQLSFGKDKLVAISGIAKYVARYLRGEYLADLWHTNDEIDFFDQLMWATSGRSEPGRWKSPTFYRAPSWSWAAVDCPVEISETDRFMKKDENMLAHVEKVEVFLRG